MFTINIDSHISLSFSQQFIVVVKDEKNRRLIIHADPNSILVDKGNLQSKSIEDLLFIHPNNNELCPSVHLV